MSEQTTGPAADSRAAALQARRRVVVAGGTGFIGSHLVVALNAAGYEVVVLSRGRHSDTGHVRYLQWNPARHETSAAATWRQALSGAEAVINLTGASAAAKRWTERRKQELVDSRVVPSRALVAAANSLDTPPAAILQASGVNYYGPGDAERDETAQAGNDFLAGLSCAWEAPLEETLIRTVTMRFGAVLDDRQGALPQMLLPFRLFAGGPVAGGNQWLSWIHVRDLVNAILFIMRHGPSAPPATGTATPLADAVNVTSPQPVRNADFAKAAGRVLRRPAFVPMPRWVIEARLGEGATIVCDGVRAVPRKLERAGFRFQYPEIGEALEDLVGRSAA